MPAPYDRIGALYDAVVRWSLYHRIVWGTTAAAYTRFTRMAVAAAGGGPFAEVECGSLLFTARVYQEASNLTLAAALPLQSRAFASILSLNLLHVPCDRQGIIAECGRLLRPGGRLFVSSLVRSGRWSDSALALYQRVGILGVPLTADQLAEAVAAGWGQVESPRVEGNLAFVVVRSSSDGHP